MEGIRQKLSVFEKYPDSQDAWQALRVLFRAISKGDVEHNVPEYDGALFEEDISLDGLEIKNKHLVSALRALMEREGLGIDYQNLGVRHLGSLYEALLEYSVRQAKEELVVYKDEIIDASFAKDLKQKPRGFIPRGELFLSIRGLERKGTGSYYTPDKIVTFLAREGLAPHLERRKRDFLEHLDLLRKTKDSREREELERRCNDDLLGLKVVDPAIGSGHFLVAAVEEITNWIIDLLKQNQDAPLLQEIKEHRERVLEEQRRKGIELDESLLSDSIILKRMIMKRCVYGVDVNYLAVELAKLSLWLDSFTIGTPLTFLEHHIKCGDSLIGLSLRDIEERHGSRTLDSWMETVSETGITMLHEVMMPPDLTKEEVEQSRKMFLESDEKVRPLKSVLDVACAGMLDEEIQKKLPRSLQLIEEAIRSRDLKKSGREKEKEREKAKKDGTPSWWPFVESARSIAKEYHAFHWELEFPEVFQEGKGGGEGEEEESGFDLLLTNPPWEAVKPEDDDFFSIYEPRFRRISSKPEKKKLIADLLKKDKDISKAYSDYTSSIEKRVKFYKSRYVKRGSGDTNLWKLFLERSLNLVKRKKGTLGMVIPSGIVTDEGAKQLREELLFRGKIKHLYEFENAEGIFPDVDRRYKFVLLSFERTSVPSESFEAAFYLHDVDAIFGVKEKEKFLLIPLELVKLCAPESLSIPELRNKASLEVFTKLYSNHPLLNDNQRRKSWTVSLLRELDRTNDSDLFRTDGKGWPLIEGKNFHQFIPDFEKPIFTVDPKQGLERTSRHREYHGINETVHSVVRLVFRDVASSTNVRTAVACIIPPQTFCSNKARSSCHPSNMTKTSTPELSLIW